jgi:hypothetical protein
MTSFLILKGNIIVYSDTGKNQKSPNNQAYADFKFLSEYERVSLLLNIFNSGVCKKYVNHFFLILDVILNISLSMHR